MLLNPNRSNIELLTERNIPQVAGGTAIDGGSASRHADHEDEGNSTTMLKMSKRQIANLETRYCTIDQRETSTPPLPELRRFVSGQWEDMKSLGSDDRLFYSAGSLEKTTSPLEKVKLVASQEILRPKEISDNKRRSRTISPQIRRGSPDNDVHTAKKRRVSHSSNEQAYLLSIDEAGQPKPSMKARASIDQTSRGPQPAWVDELSPDSMAEDTDCVGFI